MVAYNKTISWLWISLFSTLGYCQDTNAQLQQQQNRTFNDLKSSSSSTQNPSVSSSASTVTNKAVTYSVGGDGIQIIHDKAYYENQLKNIDDVLKAFDTKLDYVRNSPQEHERAISNGWYETMAIEKEKLNVQRQATMQLLSEF